MQPQGQGNDDELGPHACYEHATTSTNMRGSKLFFIALLCGELSQQQAQPRKRLRNISKCVPVAKQLGQRVQRTSSAKSEAKGV